VVSSNQRQVVGKFIATAGRAAGKKNAPAEETETLHIQSRSAEIIGVHVKLINVPLDACFICRRRVELMEPRTLQGAIPCKFRSPAGKGRQRLQVRVLFREMSEAVAQKTLIAVTEAMIQTCGKSLERMGNGNNPPLAAN